MGAVAAMNQEGVLFEQRTLLEIRDLLQQLAARRVYAETDILTIDELADAAKVGRTTIFKVLPKLPVSYGLGGKTPRVIYGDFLRYLRDTTTD